MFLPAAFVVGDRLALALTDGRLEVVSQVPRQTLWVCALLHLRRDDIGVEDGFALLAALVAEAKETSLLNLLGLGKKRRGSDTCAASSSITSTSSCSSSFPSASFTYISSMLGNMR